MKLRTIKGYPTTLKLFRLPDAKVPIWHCKLWFKGKTFKKTTKTTDLRQAENFAKAWWTDLQISLRHMDTSAKALLFDRFAELAFAENQTKIDRGERNAKLNYYDRYRYRREVKSFFGHRLVTEINYGVLVSFSQKLTLEGKSSSMVRFYFEFVRKVLNQAVYHGAISSLPKFPVLSVKQSTRGWLSWQEYKTLRKTALAIAEAKSGRLAEIARQRGGYVIDYELYFFIMFMVNTFLRPNDVKLIKHEHIEVIDQRDASYLRINTPFSKTVNTPVISMPGAVTVYRRILERQFERGFGWSEDHVFLPEIPSNRSRALAILRKQLNTVLLEAGYKTSRTGENRTIYSLRHSAIMFRLLMGNVDLLTLARNARTSVEMIDLFYAKHLTAEMNVSALHSMRPDAQRSER